MNQSEIDSPVMQNFRSASRSSQMAHYGTIHFIIELSNLFLRYHFEIASARVLDCVALNLDKKSPTCRRRRLPPGQ